PTHSTLFPYTTLFRSDRYEIFHGLEIERCIQAAIHRMGRHSANLKGVAVGSRAGDPGCTDIATRASDVLHDGVPALVLEEVLRKDRKSTRLNSSHVKS